MNDRPALRLVAPGSKSQTQRALLVAALAPGESEIDGALSCDDSLALKAALRELGITISEEGTRWRVRGGTLRPPLHPLDCGDGGTTLRFLAPLALLLEGELTLDGSVRLRERPLSELVQALGQLAVTVRYLGQVGSLPAVFRRAADGTGRAERPASGDGDDASPSVEVEASRSSQFASGLLLVAPLLPRGLRVTLAGKPVSRPYLGMTVAMMHAAGARVEEREGGYRVWPGGYRPARLTVEGDWSSAAFLLAAGFIAGREVQVVNVSPFSPQGDRMIVAFLEELRRPRAHRFDLSDCPDLIAPLAAAAVFAEHPSELLGLAHARLKESDRIAVLADELQRVGLNLEPGADRLVIRVDGSLRPSCLDPHGDHRMAMAFALLSLREPRVEIRDRCCVSKSYPRFFEDLDRLR